MIHSLKEYIALVVWHKRGDRKEFLDNLSDDKKVICNLIATYAQDSIGYFLEESLDRMTEEVEGVNEDAKQELMLFMMDVIRKSCDMYNESHETAILNKDVFVDDGKILE